MRMTRRRSSLVTRTKNSRPTTAPVTSRPVSARAISTALPVSLMLRPSASSTPQRGLEAEDDEAAGEHAGEPLEDAVGDRGSAEVRADDRDGEQGGAEQGAGAEAGQRAAQARRPACAARGVRRTRPPAAPDGASAAPAGGVRWPARPVAGRRSTLSRLPDRSSLMASARSLSPGKRLGGASFARPAQARFTSSDL